MLGTLHCGLGPAAVGLPTVGLVVVRWSLCPPPHFHIASVVIRSRRLALLNRSCGSPGSCATGLRRPRPTAAASRPSRPSRSTTCTSCWGARCMLVHFDCQQLGAVNLVPALNCVPIVIKSLMNPDVSAPTYPCSYPQMRPNVNICAPCLHMELNRTASGRLSWCSTALARNRRG